MTNSQARAFAIALTVTTLITITALVNVAVTAIQHPQIVLNPDEWHCIESYKNQCVIWRHNNETGYVTITKE